VSFLTELKRRNVFRVAVAYLVLAWLVLQVADVLVQGLELPAVWPKAVIALLALGFIPVLVFSWIYEMTPEGLKRESEIAPDQSVTAHTAKKLDVAVIALLVLAGGLYGYVNLFADRGQQSVAAPPTKASTAIDLSIAVLPFVNISADPENEYFADGLSEELLNRLAQVPDLRVAGRTSSFQFKGENRDLRDIGAQLGVAHVLEGSVRRQGDQVRITAQLIGSNDGSHLWSATYDRTLDDVFAIQDEISEAVVVALDIVLDETERQRMLDAGIRNVDAFVGYQRGLKIFNDSHGSVDDLVAGLSVGMPYFDVAVEAVPTFAAAWLARMDYFAHILFSDGYTQAEYQEALDSLHDSLDRAIEFARDPDRQAVAEIDSVLFSDNWSNLRARIERALQIDGCVTSVWGMEVATYIGYADRTERYWRGQVECAPLTAYYRSEVANALRVQGKQEEALAVFRKAATELGDDSWLAGGAADALNELGRVDEALEVARGISADTPFNAMFSVVGALAAAGRIEEAQALISEWDHRRGDRSDMFMTMAALVGDRDAANGMAAVLDARPGGTMLLLVQAYTCGCGALFDLEIAPNFAARLEEAEIPWPPPIRIEYPAKDW
jgi:TolB-like protein/tetratricopeptide (TPR) repeat protein